MRFALPRRLFPRFSLILGVPMICVQLILSYLFIEQHTNAVLTLLAKTLAGDVRVIVDLFEGGTPLSDLKLASRQLDLEIDMSSVLEIPKHGVHKNTWLYRFLKRAFELKLERPYFLRMSTHHIHILVPSHLGMFSLTTPSQRFFSQTTSYVLWGTLLSTIILFAIAFLFMRQQIYSIMSLTRAVEQLGQGHNPKDFKPQGALEVKRAGYAFLTMKDRIQRHLTGRLDMLSGISHDLRTPLTRMKLQLACLPPSESLKELDEDVNQMHQMIESFLDYARGSQPESSSTVNLKNVIEECVKGIQPFPIKILCQDDLFIFLKPLLLKRCLTNVLVNSKKASTYGVITVSTHSRFIKITLDDDGPGIPVLERQNVFRPFYRVDTSRNLNSGGLGLGLSIVQDGIQSLGGRVVLASAPYEAGLRVVFWLPKFLTDGGFNGSKNNRNISTDV